MFWRSKICLPLLGILAIVSCGISRGETGNAAGAGAVLGDAGANGGQVASGDAGAAALGGEAGTGGEAAHTFGVSIVFPTAVSSTYEDTISVRGRVMAPLGVASVSVNGVPALTADGFATWVADVPLNDGANKLVASITDQNGRRLESSASVLVSKSGWALRDDVSAMAMDSVHGQLVVFDSDVIAAVDLTSGKIRVMSGLGRGVGAALPRGDCTALVVDPANQRALSVVDDALMAIDLETGNRSVLPSLGNGDATHLGLCSRLVLDASGKTAYATRGLGSPGVVGLDLTTGARHVVIDAGLGSGPPLPSLSDIALDEATDPARPRLLIADADSAAILAIDPETGNRTLLSAAPPYGEGAPLRGPVRMQLDRAHGRLIVVDLGDSPTLVAVDLVTGNRAKLADAITEQGPFTLAVDAEGGHAYWTTSKNGHVIDLDLSSLKQMPLASGDVGDGPHLWSPGGFTLDPTSPDVLIIADQVLGGVYRVDLSTGTRTEISGSHVGQGPAFAPRDIAIDMSSLVTSPRILVADMTLPGLFAVNLATGNRTLVTSLSQGSGPPLSYPGSLASDGESVFMTELPVNGGAHLLKVDLRSGDQTLISGEQRGAGPSFSRLAGGMLIDRTTAKARALVGDTGELGIFSVDLETGDRTIVARPLNFEDFMLDAERGRLVTVDIPSDAVSAVDLINGVSTILSSGFGPKPLRGRGSPLSLPVSLSADFRDEVAFVGSLALNAILAVDLTTGERVIVSR